MITQVIGLIGEPERQERLAKAFGEALLEVLFEAGELIPPAIAALLCVAALCLVGTMVYHLMFDPNAVDVASRLDTLSIDPDKLFLKS
jgi:hypothetical protein